MYDITSLLEKLDESAAVDDSTIAHLELPFISALSHDSRRELALHREISRNPALFADLIAHMTGATTVRLTTALTNKPHG